MQKIIKTLEHVSFVFFVLIGVFAMMNTSYAISTITPLGGIVEENRSSKNVQDIENENYKCIVPGSSITVKSLKKTEGDLDFLIPYTIRSSTQNKDGKRQYFLGLYERTKQTVTCIYQGYPPNTTTTNLNRLKLYGTSKGTAKTY